ncbi:hypothetical protein AAEX28_14380 [Lentisphaerota bacterium WC36G]|nr:hypothetical protein LJT99_01135 [Lentisphaerae bacterium WC36]
MTNSDNNQQSQTQEKTVFTPNEEMDFTKLEQPILEIFSIISENGDSIGHIITTLE